MSTQETILIADDAEINRTILRSLFKGEYNLLEAENGEQALMLLRQYQESITAVLLDLVMPEKDGYQVLEAMQAGNLLYHIPVIVITADDSADSKVRVFELGASDIITKPFEPNVVLSRVKNIIELGRYRRRLEALVSEQSSRAQKSNAAIIDMLSSVIEHRSLESGQHIRRIRMFTQILLEDVAKNYQEYGLDARTIQLITDASSMHDIGKIAIPDRILNKPGRLTNEEFEVMKTHTTKGCEILAGLDQLQDPEYLLYAYNICRYHHERWDGKGYPDGLKENSIPICAQVVAIADCYDALTTDRVYKKAIPQSRAFSMILNGECGVFSPRLLECFKNVRDAFSQLSQQYADGEPADQPQADQFPAAPPRWEIGETTLEQSQLKYFALLRYLDATVMEVDVSAQVYHLVYLADQDFAMLRSMDSFEESIRVFIATCVHPDDQAEAGKLLSGHIPEFFQEGLTRRDQRYRVFDQKQNNYAWCRVSMLRINLENPRRQKFLLIWHKEEPEEPALIQRQRNVGVQNSTVLEKLLSGVQKCRNDRYFTILQVNQGLVEMLGYSKQELADQFQNRYTSLIYPADRARVAAEFLKQSNAGTAIELEYRLVTKAGRVVWVSDRCLLAREEGEEVVYCILLDITRSRQAEENLRLSLERHQIIMNQTNDIIFEWNIPTDELYLSSNWEKQFGYTPIIHQVSSAIPRASHLNPDDIPSFLQLMEVMAAGAAYKETELRIADAKGKYRWNRIRATAQFDVDGKPLKVVGVILDIDAQKKAAVELEERATRDSLTKLYNRPFAQERIESRLGSCPPEELSVLMVLDVDNFKQVNDRYGHMFGDAVLAEMSEKISSLFRHEDTVSRIGGDEFMIFMPNVSRRSAAERRAGDILRTLQELLQDTMEDVSFSCSIGLSFSCGGEPDFQTLFNQADRALYRAKAQGKNQFVCFRQEMESGPIGMPTQPQKPARTQIDSNESERWNLSLLITKVFDILYNAPELEEGIQSILALIGERFEVSRAYIIETTEPDIGTNTFEWCGAGVSPQIHSLTRVPYLSQGMDYRNNFGSNGIFYCQDVQKLPPWQRDLLERQDVLSVLQYAIRENGEFYGLVGFDDCAMHRLWTDEQAEALTFVGKLLAVFLRKQRTQEALASSLANLHTVLDHQEVWLYVLDPSTYAIRYANQKTQQLVPEARAGRRCYEVFYHRDTPCPNCVLARAKAGGQCTLECYNPSLHTWVLADAAMVTWNKQEACLVSCRDVSEYKKTAGFPDTEMVAPLNSAAVD